MKQFNLRVFCTSWCYVIAGYCLFASGINVKSLSKGMVLVFVCCFAESEANCLVKSE